MPVYKEVPDSINHDGSEKIMTKCMKLKDFLETINSHSIWFNRVSDFFDGTEFTVDRDVMNSYFYDYDRKAEFNYNILRRECDISRVDYYYEKIEKRARGFEALKYNTYASCWTVDSTPNLRLWLRKEPGVAIQTTLPSLTSSISSHGQHQIIGGEVRYRNSDGNPKNPFTRGNTPRHYMEHMSLTKNDQYRHEKEFRLVSFSPNFCNSQEILDPSRKSPTGFSESFNLKKLIKKVFIHAHQPEIVHSEVKKALEAAGINVPIQNLVFQTQVSYNEW